MKFTLVLTFVCFLLSFTQDNRLILRLSEGQTVKYTNQLSTITYADENMQSPVAKGEFLFNQQLTIIKALESGYEVDLKLLRIKFKQESSRWSMDYDSDRKDAIPDGRGGMMVMIMNSLLEEKYKLEVNNTGKVVKKPKIQTPDGNDIGAAFGNVFIELPGTPVRIGDSWFNELTFRNTKIQLMHTVTGVVNGLIEMDTEIVGDEYSRPGKTYIDPATGLLVKSEFETISKQFNQMLGSETFVKTKVNIQIMP
ncbi:hypothetical protein [Schleiferia thermophila]|jgi:hypothetical protein|uniref:Uncharacterized protein n=4 Tax=Schleiferia thermophila TaxID=884107 RepID=A0A368ZYN9_9FLAO|nr:hypothetical protein [Schleiferia thermophila]RCX02142.1 hypothetical protein DES35_105113 [Schleiferia thermophila]GCD80663.1 hypothetical protein JCM30197_19100 [Schleiferia thermophila]